MAIWLRKKSRERRYASSGPLNASVLYRAKGSSDASANSRYSAAHLTTLLPVMGGYSWFQASLASAKPSWQMSFRRGLKLVGYVSSGGDAGSARARQPTGR